MMEAVRVLAMDHFFDQDLQALEGHPRLNIRRFPYQRLRDPAIRMMGDAVATGLRAYAAADLDPARRRYAAWLHREVRRLYLESAFDVLVLPSDTFFYVRSLIDAAHDLGLPVVVVQKETTISAATMDLHSREVHDAAPFIADFMTVCSERHREFWLRAGADGARIEVTGQPRFDVYARRPVSEPSPRRRVLFLSYELGAYVEGLRDGAGPATWEPLRDATEAALFQALRAGLCEVVVKCHPQQNHRVERARLARRAGADWQRGLRLAPPDADTRSLILNADVVIGFQTTAIYEAMAARRPVVYAAWGTEFERFRDGLIPFHLAPSDCVLHATSPQQLATLLQVPLAPPSGQCSAWYEEALGPVDGDATERVVARLEAVAAAWPATAARRDLDLRRRRFAPGLLVRSLAAEAVWAAAIPMARMAGERRSLAKRRQRAHEGRKLAVAALRRTDNRHGGGQP